MFGFRKQHINRLKRALRIPDHVVYQDSVFTGEEVLLAGLYRLRSPGDLHNVSKIFGREYCQWGKAFRWFVKHIYDNFSNRLQDLSYWEPLFMECSEKIRLKLESFQRPGVSWEPGKFEICGFIDDKCWETLAPGGPIRSGANALRVSLLLQRAFYNGWKCIHGLKCQTVVLPNGMTCDMFGPKSLRNNDLILLRDSTINERMYNVQMHVPEQLQKKFYGDSIFPWLSHIRSKIPEYRLPDGEAEAINSAMKKVRISVEWSYWSVISIFEFLNYRSNIKIRENPNINEIYFVATFLTNCHNCLHPNQTSEYFGMLPPTLEHYCDNLHV
jgi:hypothetical protein